MVFFEDMFALKRVVLHILPRVNPSFVRDGINFNRCPILVYIPSLSVKYHINALKTLRKIITRNKFKIHKEKMTSKNSPGTLNSNEAVLTTEELVRRQGFPIETHEVVTPDGYILCLHRIPRSEASVILLWHGLMMSSESWVCNPNRKLVLAFELYEKGYDIWLGNTRGNKHSYKHVKMNTNQKEYWDYSIDESAKYDLPSSVDYILSHTKAKTLSYIAFSQGTAQAFAALSRNSDLNNKINILIALAPAAVPSNFSRNLPATIVNSSPESLFLLFGKKSFLSVIDYMKHRLSSTTYANFISKTLYYLFGWKSEQIEDKSVLFNYIYSSGSVKQVVHWLQIIRRSRFQEFEHASLVSKNHIPPEYDISNIIVPVALFYGKQDRIVKIDWFLSKLRYPVLSIGFEKYEHICFLWARDINVTVYPSIFLLLQKYNPSPEIKSYSYPGFSSPPDIFSPFSQQLFMTPTANSVDPDKYNRPPSLNSSSSSQNSTTPAMQFSQIQS